MAALLTLTVFAGCGREGREPEAPGCSAPQLFVTEAHDGSIIPMRVGDVVDVRLSANDPVEPAEWALAAAPPQLRLCESDVASKGPGAPGAGAVSVFGFVAVAEGGGRLVFDDGKTRRRVSFEVQIDNDMIID